MGRGGTWIEFAVWCCRTGWLISHSHDYIDEMEDIYMRPRKGPRPGWMSDWVRYSRNIKRGYVSHPITSHPIPSHFVLTHLTLLSSLLYPIFLINVRLCVCSMPARVLLRSYLRVYIPVDLWHLVSNRDVRSFDRLARSLLLKAVFLPR